MCWNRGCDGWGRMPIVSGLLNWGDQSRLFVCLRGCNAAGAAGNASGSRRIRSDVWCEWRKPVSAFVILRNPKTSVNLKVVRWR